MSQKRPGSIDALAPETDVPRQRDDNEFEAYELRSYHHTDSHPVGSGSSPTDDRPGAKHRIGSSRPISPFGPLRKFWRNHVSVTVRQDDCRDHFALERTFLAYLRTSVMLSMMGVVLAQLFRLQHSPKPDPKLGFFVLAKPLSGLCICSAMVVACLGCHRFWRQQQAMLQGKIFAGGWELAVVGIGMFLITFAIFALLVAIDVDKEM